MQVLLVLILGFFTASWAVRLGPGPKHRRFVGGPVNIEARHETDKVARATEVISPRFFIISLFSSEADIWYKNMPTLLRQNITVPGASPLYSDVHCTSSGHACQMTLGEGEINAAASATALIYSGLFDLKKTYFLVAGIAGINPHLATTGSATFPRYAVQFDLQFEIDSRQIPQNDSSGYFPQFNFFPDEKNGMDYPGTVYGTEAFELNARLRDRFMNLARTNPLTDSHPAQKYRKTYTYAPGNRPPAVVACDTGTSNVYWSGSVLGKAFSAYTKLVTNGTGEYCATQQEDNAVLETLLRGDLAGKVNFARVAIMRTASDFDRAPEPETETFHLFYANQNGFDISIENIFVAGHPILRDVVDKWDSIYEKGIKPTNYIGDLYNSLGRRHPDIGTQKIYIN